MNVVIRCPFSQECFEGEWPEKIKAGELIESLRLKAQTLGVPIQVEILAEGQRRVLALSPEGILFEGALFAPHKVGAARKVHNLKNPKTIKKRGKP